MTRIQLAAFALTACFAGAALSKIPPPPPLDDKAKAAAEEKKAKEAAAAEKAKTDQAAAEDKTVKNFQANMKKAGKPVPKPVPVVAAAPPQIVPAPAAGTSAKGHEQGAMTPAGNTPTKGNEKPADAKK